MSRALVVAAALLAAAAVPALAQEAPAEPITRDTCSACHDEAETFAHGPHGLAMARRDPAILERSCVACHGPADAHVEDPSPENIVRHPGDDVCKSCHQDAAGKLALSTPAHVRHGVACLDCHSPGHEDTGQAHLLARAPAELCASCHRTQAAAASMPFAHRDGDRPFSCTNCHSVHGAERPGRLALLGNGGACVECHTEKAGPYVFPHPPREVGGCVSCHEPHGSPNPRMLTRRTVESLCLECHAGIPAFHDLSQARYRACQSCHVAVHGSNRDARLFDE